MNTRTILIGGMLATVSVTVVPFALGAGKSAEPINVAETADIMFSKMDLNKDGKISAIEYGAAARQLFNAMDTNKDSFVSAEEMAAAMPAPSGKLAGKKDQSAVEKIKLEDSNKDGMLSSEEHAATARAKFEKMDKNHDGFLSKEELAAGIAADAAKKRK